MLFDRLRECLSVSGDPVIHRPPEPTAHAIIRGLPRFCVIRKQTDGDSIEHLIASVRRRRNDHRDGYGNDVAVLERIKPVLPAVARLIDDPARLRIGTPRPADEVHRSRLALIVGEVQRGIFRMAVQLGLAFGFLEMAPPLVGGVEGRNDCIGKCALPLFGLEIKEASVKEFPRNIAPVWNLREGWNGKQ